MFVQNNTKLLTWGPWSSEVFFQEDNRRKYFLHTSFKRLCSNIQIFDTHVLNQWCQTHFVLWVICPHLGFTRARQFCTYSKAKLVPFDIFWRLYSIDRKRVTENSKISFQIFKINKSYYEYIGNSSNPPRIYTTSCLWTEEVVNFGLLRLLSRNVALWYHKKRNSAMT